MIQNVAQSNQAEGDKKLPGSWVIPVFQGKMLFCLRDDGLWDIPGGTKEPLESSMEAAVRELREEVGISLSISDLHPVGVDIIDERYLGVYCAEISADQAKGIVLQELEHSDYQWVSSYTEINGEFNPPTLEFIKQGWLDNVFKTLEKVKEKF